MTAYLLDEHLSPDIAVQLTAHGVDTEAVASGPDLRTLSDPDILEAAAAEHRVLVTRNVGDFIVLDALWASQGRQHSGILCISTRKLPEDSAFIGAVTISLTDWSKTAPDITGTYAFL